MPQSKSTIDITRVRSDLREALELAEQCIQKEEFPEAISKLRSGIAKLDEVCEASQVNLTPRERLEEYEKNLAIDLWLTLLKAELRQEHLYYNPVLAIESLEESIDRLVCETERHLGFYKLRNRLDLTHKLYLAYEKSEHEFTRRGIIEEASRSHYHKMAALAKYHFEQVKHCPYGLIRRGGSLIRCGLLTLLWWSSDFGQNTLKFIRALLVLTVGFGLIYTLFGEFQPPPGMPNLNFSIWWHKPIFSLYTSLVTLFTLGGVQPTPVNELTHGLVLLEFIFGYIFLGLLVAMMTKRMVR